MASEVDICNLALGHLGDTATVASINPPEGSAQSEHCARFYPIARDALLEMHPWGFATKRVNLAALTSTWPEWQYAYALPGDVVNLLAVMPPNASDDYSVPMQSLYNINGAPIPMAGQYQPQPYNTEVLDDGTSVIYTNQENAMLRYTALVTDPTKFSPLFVETLGYLLASKLAGPVIKGEDGRAVAKSMLATAMIYLGKAETSDANQRRTTTAQNVGWITGR